MGLSKSSLSEGLAETFCLTDPSRRDNPIIFASEGTYRDSFPSKSGKYPAGNTNQLNH